MGMFSWDCRVCGHPALCDHATDQGINEWMSEVVVLGNAGRIEGFYDGYGRVEGRKVRVIDVYEPCLYHRACWVAAGKPDYDGIPSKSSEDQGWFFDVGAHDMLEPGIEHPPGALDMAQAAREARLAEQRRHNALAIYEQSCELGADPWKALFSLSQRHSDEGYMLCDKLDGDWHPHDTLDEAVAHAEKLWATFTKDEVPGLLAWRDRNFVEG